MSKNLLREYVDRKFPTLTAIEEPDMIKRQRTNRENFLIYYQFIDKFVDFNEPGYVFRENYNMMLNSLTFPNDIAEFYRLSSHDDIIDDDLNEEEKLLIKQLFFGGKAVLIPSFFNLIKSLNQIERDFSIVFRTFGHELEMVIDEFNLFCKGKHPLYNGKHNTLRLIFDGSQNTRNLMISSENKGFINRKTETDSVLVIGTLDKSIFSQINSNNIQIFDENSRSHDILSHKIHTYNSFALIDDFNY